ncbi:hypothetical protein D3C80_1694470 [compost metagenome]
MIWVGCSRRVFSIQPMLTSCSMGLATRSVVGAALVPLKPIMMRSRPWRWMMASRMRVWKSSNLAQASILG